MFEHLDSVDWSKFNHAHGVATDIPNLLLTLVFGDMEDRMQAIGELHETIWHQGTIYSASAEVVPFLFEIIEHRENFQTAPDNPTPDEAAASLVCCIATGEGCIQYRIRKGASPEALRTEAEIEQEFLQRIQESLKAGLPKLKPYLNSPEGLGTFVIDVLANYPDQSDWILLELDGVLASSADEDIRKAAVDSRNRLTSVTE